MGKGKRGDKHETDQRISEDPAVPQALGKFNTMGVHNMS